MAESEIIDTFEYVSNKAFESIIHTIYMQHPNATADWAIKTLKAEWSKLEKQDTIK